jgi:hypothetical protein
VLDEVEVDDDKFYYEVNVLSVLKYQLLYENDDYDKSLLDIGLYEIDVLVVFEI